MNTIKGIAFGHISEKILKYKQSNAKKINEYKVSLTLTSEKQLEFNAMIPIYCLKIVMGERDLDLVFQSFKEIKKLISEYFMGLKITQWEKYQKKIVVPSIGRILWNKVRYYIKWRLGSIGRLPEIYLKKEPSFCKLVLLSKILSN